ncbi:CoA-binding protein [Pilobolus umbonatus]|nr:CoA-binding protein [Pilobolus umbonatus]
MISSPQQFIQSPYFAVVGASSARNKFGNRILRWYQVNKLNVIPVNPKEAVIETIPTVSSIEELLHPQRTALSIITPPKVTLQVLQTAKRLGIKHIWIQPGAEDIEVLKYAQEAGLNVIAGGPCLLVDGPSLLQNKSQL